VILPIKEYNKIMEELDSIEDIKLYDQAKTDKSKSMPFDTYLKKRALKKK
jgi:hypothetical protein